MAICPSCFERVDVEATVCSHCGKVLQVPAQAQAAKRRIAPTVVAEPSPSEPQTEQPTKRLPPDGSMARLSPFGLPRLILKTSSSLPRLLPMEISIPTSEISWSRL